MSQKAMQDQAYSENLKKKDRPDIIVNNVGDTLNILDPYCGLSEWTKLFNLILGTAIEINNNFIPYMSKKKKWGRIVNIAAGASYENSGPSTILYF